MSHLVACTGCDRHVRSSEIRCPFCGDAFDALLRGSPAPRTPTGRLGRAAIFAFGTALAAASGCGESHNPDEDAGVDAGTIMAAYGTPPDASFPPPDAGADAGDVDAGDDAGFDAGEIFPPYGTPPADGVV